MRHAWISAMLAGSALAGQGSKPPEKLLFRNKGGDARFTHAAHITREKGKWFLGKCLVARPLCGTKSANPDIARNRLSGVLMALRSRCSQPRYHSVVSTET
jgi:hypothetical protein